MTFPMRLAFSLLVVAVFVMLAPSEADAIKRDRAVEAKSYPEAVLITAMNTRKKVTGLCSGALIAPNVVLTTAVCGKWFDAWEVQAPYAKGGAARAKVKAAKVNPDYKPAYRENAFALLILEKDIDIGRKFPALHDGDLLPLGTKLTLVGRVDNGKVSRENLYVSAVVTLVSDELDTKVYGGTPHVVEKGDLGGPVYSTKRDGKIVAVISGDLDTDGEPVPTDLFSPITRKNLLWFTAILQEAAKGRAKEK